MLIGVQFRQSAIFVNDFRCLEVAGGLGFEPRLTESESAVLPLNYPPTKHLVHQGFLGELRMSGWLILHIDRLHAPI